MAEVTWTDVAPRDGLQNISATVPTEVKVRLIEGLLAAGVPRVEATSFVSPTWVPQLADAAAVLRALGPAAIPRLRVLIPNRRGLELALEHDVRNVLYTIGATDTFNRRNVNRGVAESLDNVTWVPSQALYESDGKAFVYLKSDKGFMPRDVNLVNRSESQAVISGLNEGDVVAMSNPTQQQSKPGSSGQNGAMKALQK